MPLSNLNAEQKQAATASLEHNLIIASAGTGKTSTIVGRIAYLLSVGIQPSEIISFDGDKIWLISLIQK